MPTRLLLEGSDLQELLAQVREEHGARAKIVSAERVRAGGLTGLLRAERYELTVELPDDETAEMPIPVGAAAGGGAAGGAAAGGGAAGKGPAAGAKGAGAGSSGAGVMPGATGPKPSAVRPAEPPAGPPASAGALAAATSAIAAVSGRSGQTPAVPAPAAGTPAATREATPGGATPAGLPAASAAAAPIAPAPGAATTGAIANQSAYGGGTPKPGNASRPPAGGRTGNTPGAGGYYSSGSAGGAAAAPSDNGQGEHGPDVDELLALLDQREASTPDSASVGGFDEVLAELRAANGAAAASAAAVAPANGTSAAAPSPIAPRPGAAAPDETIEFSLDPMFGAASGAQESSTGPFRATARVAVPQPAAPTAQPPAPAPAATPMAQPATPATSAAQAAQALQAAQAMQVAEAMRAAHAAQAAQAMQAAQAAPAPPTVPTPTATPAGAPTPAATALPTIAAPVTTTPSATLGSAASSGPRIARTRPITADPILPDLSLDFPDVNMAEDSRLVARLADLGVPDRILEKLTGGEAYPAIVRALADEPTAPGLPTGPGMIITIIGELTGALGVAEDLARILRLDATRILIASESPQVGRHMADHGDAARQAVRLRGGDQPRLVCVDAPSPTGWVQQVIMALRPDAVWCAVDATRKPADVARQLRSLPRVDALAVHALEATADPASPLALGVPIALLDGQPAGPHGWAALLSRRLFEEEHSGVDS